MPDPVARLNAALEGRYAIGRELGEGGMARKVRVTMAYLDPIGLSSPAAQGMDDEQSTPRGNRRGAHTTMDENRAHGKMVMEVV